MKKEQTHNLSLRITLLVTTLVSFMTGYTGSAINAPLPAIGREFGMDAVSLGWIVTVYPLTAAAFLIPFGRLADIYGRKKIFTLGVLTYTAASFLSAISTSGVMLIAFRVLQGTGASMLFPTGVAILSSVFAPGERGRVLGINVASVYLGLSFGPFLGGLLTDHLGWRYIFWATLALGVAIIPLVFWKMRGEWAEAKGNKFDLRGSIIYSLSLLGVVSGLSLLPSSWGVLIMAVGILSGVVFVRWESRVSSPVLNLALFRHNRVFVFSNIAGLINYCSTYAITFLISLYLQYLRGFNPEGAGLILVTMPAVQAMVAPFAGRFSDRFEPRILSSTGMAFTVVGLVLLAAVNEGTPIAYILASLGISGLGFALFVSPNTNAVMSSVDRSYFGVASATIATMRQVGFTLSMAITMLIISLHVGRVAITPEYYGPFLTSVKASFTVFAALCFGGIFASLARGKVKRTAGQVRTH